MQLAIRIGMIKYKFKLRKLIGRKQPEAEHRTPPIFYQFVRRGMSSGSAIAAAGGP